MRTASLLSATALVVLSCSAFGQAQQPTIPSEVFRRPSGPYAVGTLDTLWVDQRRPESLTKEPNDRRHVPVRIWYPAQATGTSPAPYILRPEEFGPQSPFKPVLHVTTNALLGAPIFPEPKRYPVLLYNHGGGWSRFTATFEVEQLASLGYIVVSVDHLGFDQSTSLSNGYEFLGDTLGFPAPTNTDLRADALASWDYLEQVLFPMWVADAQFVLDRVEGLDRDDASPFKGRIDLQRIGAFGWSFGGAAAVDLLIRDPRVGAAIDQDGQLFGLGRVKGANRPVMLMHNTSDPHQDVPKAQHAVVDEMVKAVEGWNAKFRAASTSDVYDLKIARTQHANFSDLLLFYPRDTSQLEPRRAHDIITAYTVAFFDRYLRDGKSPLLDGRSADFSEVTFERQRSRH